MSDDLKEVVEAIDVIKEELVPVLRDCDRCKEFLDRIRQMLHHVEDLAAILDDPSKDPKNVGAITQQEARWFHCYLLSALVREHARMRELHRKRDALQDRLRECVDALGRHEKTGP